MKQLFLLALILQSLNVSSQNLSVIYAQEWHIEELAPGLGADVARKVNNCISLYQYNHTGNCSEYYFVENRKKYPDLPGKMTINETIVYKDLARNHIYKMHKSRPDVVSLDKLEANKNWEISEKDTMSICGYLCHKGVQEGNKSVEVWFAPDLPVLDGPMEYFGLPGFILRVRHKGMSLTATTVAFPESLPPVQLPVREKYVTPVEFKQLNNPE